MSSRKKLLLMGRSSSGKSSMRSIIFSNYSAFDTARLNATIDVEHSHLRFLGHMTLNLWDCGGQDSFMGNYFTTQKDHIFRSVEVLIYVFDVTSKSVPQDIETFEAAIKSLAEFSPNAKVFVLLHKMDLVKSDHRIKTFDQMMERLSEIAKPTGIQIRGYMTSIWDETLYKAWSSIVCELIPNMAMFNKHLSQFAYNCRALEVALFEKTTFLVIAHVNGRTNPEIRQDEDVAGSLQRPLDQKRFEKISNIIKTYKTSCSKARTQFKNISVKGPGCSVFIENLTKNTFIMVALPELRIEAGGSIDVDSNAIKGNIRASRKWFEKIEEEQS